MRDHHRRRLLAIPALASVLVLSVCTSPVPENAGAASDKKDEASADQAIDERAPVETEEASEADDDDPDEEVIEPEPPAYPASNTTGLEPLRTLTPDTPISPKSVVSSGHGLIIANNMMYQHSVTLFDATTGEAVQHLPDTVNADEWGLESLSGEIRGAPVEAVWTEDGAYAYVSQYQVTGHGAIAEDNCTGGAAITPSLVYRYSVEAADWDQVIEVGRVPKYVALTPDESTLLVSNWCDASLSVVDADTGEELQQIPVNNMPRGIAALPDNQTVYVTAMYAHELHRVDLAAGKSEVVMQTGNRPRHLVLSPDGEHMYMIVTGADQLLKLSSETAEVVATVTTRSEPRTMDISADGTALYVVNYNENTVTKYDAETLEELVTQPAGHLPIGVTHDAGTGQVWVANYGGTINVYDDTDGAAR